MSATVYILYAAHLDRFYIGHTTEGVEERLRKHFSAHSGWTSRAKDWRIVHVEYHADKAAAYRREREVKGWRKRSRIEELIGAAR